jgi:hypothetical protein
VKQLHASASGSSQYGSPAQHAAVRVVQIGDGHKDATQLFHLNLPSCSKTIT